VLRGLKLLRACRNALRMDHRPRGGPNRLVVDGLHDSRLLSAQLERPRRTSERVALIALRLMAARSRPAAREQGLAKAIVTPARSRKNARRGAFEALEHGSIAVVEKQCETVKGRRTSSILCIRRRALRARLGARKSADPFFKPGRCFVFRRRLGHGCGGAAGDMAPGICRRRFISVPAHPVAGTEAFRPRIFRFPPSCSSNRWCILTAAEGTDRQAVEEARGVWDRARRQGRDDGTPTNHDLVPRSTSIWPH